MTAPDVPTAVLFTDIEGSTERWERAPDLMAEALRRHDALMGQAFSGGSVHILKHTGDGLVVTAADVAELLTAAVRAQMSLDAADWAAVGGLRVRMGLHSGEFFERDGDLFGPAMNLAARVADGAAGGQIVLTASAAEQIDASFEWTIESLGSFRFRGVRDPVAVCGVRFASLDPEVSPYRSLRSIRGNLPASTTSVVGRDQQIDELLSMLVEPGLVSLIGPGGVGKTTLATTVANRMVTTFPDGCWFVDLLSLHPGDDPASLIAGTLGLDTRDDQHVAELLRVSLAERTMLVVLDNCEHVIDELAPLVHAVFAPGCSSTLLLTTQEALDEPSEVVVRVAPLDSDRSTKFGVELFVNRATALNPSFVLGPDDEAVLVDLCHRLDGLPLAIELAASRSVSLSVSQIAEHLGEPLRLLRRSGRDRHSALETTIEWSVGLLPAAERSAFIAMSVFDGPFDVGQAAAAAGLDTLAAADCIELLVRRSMLRDVPGDVPRFRLTDPVRKFGLGLLDEAGARNDVLDRVADLVVATVAEAQPLVRGPAETVWFERLRVMGSAIRMTVEHLHVVDPERCVGLVVGLYHFLMSTGAHSQAARWLADGIEKCDSIDPDLASRAWSDAGTFEFLRREYERSRTYILRSMAASEEAGQPPRPSALLRLAGLELLAGDIASAQTLLESSLSALEDHHDPSDPPGAPAAAGAFLAGIGQAERGVSLVLAELDDEMSMGPSQVVALYMNLGFAYSSIDPDRSVDAFLEARAQARATGALYFEAYSTSSAARVLRNQGREDEAVQLAAEAIPPMLVLELREEVSSMVRLIGGVLSARGRPDGSMLLSGLDRLNRSEPADLNAEPTLLDATLEDDKWTVGAILAASGGLDLGELADLAIAAAEVRSFADSR